MSYSQMSNSNVEIIKSEDLISIGMEIYIEAYKVHYTLQIYFLCHQLYTVYFYFISLYPTEYTSIQ